MTDMDVAYWMAKYDQLKEDYADLNCHYAAAEDRINELENPWVSVEDRLPEEGTDVLVTVKNKSCEYIAVGYYFKREGWTESYTDEAITVAPTHWMPLPQLPKEG